jgi:hypothetical protein
MIARAKFIQVRAAQLKAIEEMQCLPPRQVRNFFVCS